jgi:hypothetical protein
MSAVFILRIKTAEISQTIIILFRIIIVCDMDKNRGHDFVVFPPAVGSFNLFKGG